METDGGLSLKDRLAMLQASNSKNPQLAGPMKSPPHVPHKSTAPSPSSAETKPAVTAIKPPTTAVKPGANTAAGDKGKANGPPTPNKPLKPSVTPVGNTNCQDSTQFPFKLRPTGVQLGEKGVTPLSPNKPGASETGGGGTAPLVPKKPNGVGVGVTPLVPKIHDSSSQEDTKTTSVTMSIQERLAALKDKSKDSGGDSKAINSDPKSPVTPQNKVPVFPKPNSTGPATDVTSVQPSDLARSIREAGNRIQAGRKSSETFLRHSDGKRFRKLDVDSVVSSEPAPAKPAAITNVDFATFLRIYATAKEIKLKVDAARSGMPAEEDGAMDDLYVEAESSSVPLRVRGSESVKRATSVRISEIPELTEEEEEMYTEGASAFGTIGNIPEAPEDEYNDCASAAAQLNKPPQPDSEFEEPDEIYEPLDDEIDAKSPAPAPSSPASVDDKKAKKEKEKEKEKEKDKGGKKKDKAKEEAMKREEKERKKREEEIKKQRSKFGLKDTDEKIGDGVVKNNASAGVFTKELNVNKGEIIAILRMDHNPVGKWLVQNEHGKLGYVNSNNIEVATPAIRNMMTGLPAQDDEETEELYEPLPEGEMDEIYEEL